MTLDKQLVWVREPTEGFVLARLHELLGEEADVVPLDNKHSRRVVSFDDIVPAGDPDKDFDDNCELMFLNEATLLNNIICRYKKKKIYTYVANILLAVNPYEDIPDLYSSSTIKKYQGRSLGELPPHVFAIADKAFRDMKSFKQSQSIIVSGESGAGKTESTKYILKYLCDLWAKGAGPVEQKILDANPILEAFGNAKTTRNNNSSRFGKFIEVHFNNKYQVVGGHISHYLLEKSRICMQSAEERNYHVFYLLCAGAPAELRSDLNITKPDDYQYLKNGCTQYFLTPESEKKISNSQKSEQQRTKGGLRDPILDDVEDFQRLHQALARVGLSDAERRSVYGVVAGVLHLGNVQFEEEGGARGGCSVSAGSQHALNTAARLLGADAPALRTALVSRLMQSARAGHKGTAIIAHAPDTRAPPSFMFCTLPHGHRAPALRTALVLRLMQSARAGYKGTAIMYVLHITHGHRAPAMHRTCHALCRAHALDTRAPPSCTFCTLHTGTARPRCAPRSYRAPHAERARRIQGHRHHVRTAHYTWAPRARDTQRTCHASCRAHALDTRASPSCTFCTLHTGTARPRCAPRSYCTSCRARAPDTRAPPSCTYCTLHTGTARPRYSTHVSCLMQSARAGHTGTAIMYVLHATHGHRAPALRTALVSHLMQSARAGYKGTAIMYVLHITHGHRAPAILNARVMPHAERTRWTHGHRHHVRSARYTRAPRARAAHRARIAPHAERARRIQGHRHHVRTAHYTRAPRARDTQRTCHASCRAHAPDTRAPPSCTFCTLHTGTARPRCAPRSCRTSCRARAPDTRAPPSCTYCTVHTGTARPRYSTHVSFLMQSARAGHAGTAIMYVLHAIHGHRAPALRTALVARLMQSARAGHKGTAIMYVLHIIHGHRAPAILTARVMTHAERTRWTHGHRYHVRSARYTRAPRACDAHRARVAPHAVRARRTHGHRHHVRSARYTRAPRARDTHRTCHASCRAHAPDTRAPPSCTFCTLHTGTARPRYSPHVSCLMQSARAGHKGTAIMYVLHATHGHRAPAILTARVMTHAERTRRTQGHRHHVRSARYTRAPRAGDTHRTCHASCRAYAPDTRAPPSCTFCTLHTGTARPRYSPHVSCLMQNARAGHKGTAIMYVLHATQGHRVPSILTARVMPHAERTRRTHGHRHHVRSARYTRAPRARDTHRTCHASCRAHAPDTRAPPSCTFCTLHTGTARPR
ncbi:unnamed protein product [Parnassius apollo]|uniref:(apollo) hypothetical protein n=1 Tax=Parnassius apollo TaxID=110799 RepID=A0A8S3XXM5_PARAO|nr:unnamed protein product [Parnassius apollo]